MTHMLMDPAGKYMLRTFTRMDLLPSFMNHYVLPKLQFILMTHAHKDMLRSYTGMHLIPA